mmetsp:Transcript_60368/g.72569  ORF Transcript_60368/g.72569 Transcript_60368/m.72569 type:complete len:82 (-) Transcript_60368:41-286(-)
MITTRDAHEAFSRNKSCMSASDLNAHRSAVSIGGDSTGSTSIAAFKVRMHYPFERAIGFFNDNCCKLKYNHVIKIPRNTKL